ncbi:MAG: uroporphyrinogen-III synthase [Saprospiraceae bacterium]|nr:uroporphyrinogen-III synthase [Bacteroidia bacterium]NNE16757.1 uroporphyrinogen-III synthase [Saprospiraceae bacterium]NNL92328.1 uroporphyrinogen-III synthase [Saprospiraceae bacterium]
MASGADSMSTESYKRIDSILISQPKPERSPYFDIASKWGIKIDWRPFIHVEGVTEKEFRKNRLRPDEFTAIIFTSKNSIEHFFRMCEEMRVQMSQQTKYFCLSEAIANYLQKFIVYRKRKVFVGVRKIQDLETAFNKHKEKEKFLLPCSNLGSLDVVKYLEENEINFKEAMMYRTVASDLSDLKDITYDCLVFFSPLGIHSLYENFPNFEQNETRLAVYGTSTTKAVEERGLKVNIKAPAPESPSMSMALTNYLNKSNK